MNVFLIRKSYKTHTTGTLLTDKGGVFYTLERPWLNNKSNISCIPPGEYLVKFLPRSASGKYRNCWHLQSVDGRFGILIHNGNFVSHTKGCILIGMKHGFLARKPAILSSKVAMRKFLEHVGKEDFKLVIV